MRGQNKMLFMEGNLEKRKKINTFHCNFLHVLKNFKIKMYIPCK